MQIYAKILELKKKKKLPELKTRPYGWFQVFRNRVPCMCGWVVDGEHQPYFLP